MAYVAWSVVFGEQPTAAKWNILGENDASFHDGTGIDDDAILNRHLAAGAVEFAQLDTDLWVWEVLADVTLGSVGDTLSSGTFSGRKFLYFLWNIVNSGALQTQMRFNNDSGNNYSFQYLNGSTFGGSASASGLINFGTASNPLTGHGIITNNNAAEEKMVNVTGIRTGGAGAGNVPVNTTFWGKWANTSNQITRIDLLNTNAGDFAAGSRLIVLGHN